VKHSLPAPRLLAVVAPVCAAGLAVTCAGVFTFALEQHKATTLLGLIALIAASTLADRFPVPVEGIDTGASIYPEEWPEGGGPSPDDPNRKAVS